MPKALTAVDIDILKKADMLRPLLALEGWKYYTSILEQHLAVKTNEALAPAKSEMDLYLAEAHKGAILGLKLALGICSSIIQEADRIRSQKSNPGEE